MVICKLQILNQWLYGSSLAHLLGFCPEPFNPFFRGRMGAEESLGILGGKRRNDEHMGRGFCGPGHGPGPGIAFDLGQSVRQGIGVPAELAAGIVRHVFPGP